MATFGWYREATPAARRALGAACLGWALDSFDVNLYALVLASVMADLGFGKSTAGLIGSFTLVASAFGGILFGVIADRYGRTRALIGSILIYSRVHRRLRAGADRVAPHAVPRPARHRHGRRMGQRRGARVGDLARRASRQGAGRRAELVGRGLRRGGHRHAAGAAGLGLARGVLRRHPARAGHGLGAPQRARNPRCGGSRGPRTPAGRRREAGWPRSSPARCCASRCS